MDSRRGTLELTRELGIWGIAQSIIVPSLWFRAILTILTPILNYLPVSAQPHRKNVLNPFILSCTAEFSVDGIDYTKSSTMIVKEEEEEVKFMK